MADIKPNEIRIDKRVVAPTGFTVTKVYPGICNAVMVGQVFKTFVDANRWAGANFPGVPRIRGW